MKVKVVKVNENEPIGLLDPSELHRPEPKFAAKENYRDYTIDANDPIQERVRQTYLKMHTHQTVDYVKGKINQWCKFDTFKSTMKDALIRLNDLVDESDPDVDIPNIVHAFQTAERIRKEHPDKEWLQLTGLIHDAGKVMAFYGEPQWSTVGDTFVVGCQWSDNIVYRATSFRDNQDGKNPKYNSKYGIYEPNCGLENVLLSWGHDEYLYRMLRHNRSKLPAHALNTIRFHSFYPWHGSGDYTHLTNSEDRESTLKWVLLFNQYDLYTKGAEVPDIDALWPYYEKLIDKYIPGVLEW